MLTRRPRRDLPAARAAPLKSATWHYTGDQLLAAIRSVGIGAGDVVCLQVSLGRLGLPRDVAKSYDAISNFVLDAFLAVLGPAGTLIIPTYTYSIGRGEVFEVETTPAAIGEFPEIFRQRPGVIRSRDPMLSAAGIGPRAWPILRNVSRECYGRGSVFDNLTRENAFICTLGLGIWWATYCHHIEATANAPFRFKKVFRGAIRERGEQRVEEWIYFAAPYIENCQSNSLALEAKAREAGILKVASVGRGEIATARASELLNVGLAGLQQNPWLTAKGPACDFNALIRMEDQRVGAPTFNVELQPGASMTDMIEAVWRLPRNVVSPGYDAALTALARQVPMTIHRYPTGSEYADTIVPEQWICRSGRLQRHDGSTVFSTADNPLHVALRSHPFEGEVTRAELFRHLHVHPLVADATPQEDLAGKRDWGLCCSQQIRQSLVEDRYRVTIDTAFSYGALSVGEVVVAGASEQCVVLCAHLDGCMQVNDGLSGVVVGIEVMRALGEHAKLRFSYRLLIVPGVIGSLAYLTDHRDDIALMRGGVLIDMAGLVNPLILESSLDPASAFDRCCRSALDRSDFDVRTALGSGAHPLIARQFNALGVPLMSLARIDEQAQRDHALAFSEHRSDRDDPRLVSVERLQMTRNVVLRIIENWERESVPAHFGEVRRRAGASDAFLPLQDTR